MAARAFPNRFADAEASFADARFVLTGVPYERTVSFREGTSAGPDAIRQASWNFESFSLRNRVDLATVAVHDAGNLDVEELPPEKMVEAVESAARRIVESGKFPIFLGGEHGVVPPVVRAVAHAADVSVLALDAHLDYRAEYEGSRFNHACALRRIADVVGPDRVFAIGVRSAEAEELRDAERDGLSFVTAHEVAQRGMASALHAALSRLPSDAIYLTLDIDVLDPAFAPGTGTPEPFGLGPQDVLRAIVRVAPHLVGFDVNEVSPPWDHGTTAGLAAKLVRETVAEVASRGPPA